MGAGVREDSSEIHQSGTVQPQFLNGGTAGRRQAENERVVFIPCKVIGPAIGARMEQGMHFTGDRIDGLDTGVLPVIAPLAGQRQIGELRRSAARPWNNVFDRERIG